MLARQGSTEMNGFSHLHRFSDLAEIQRLVRSFGWDLSYTQIAPGKVVVEAYETQIGDCLLFRERFGCPVMAYGTSTPEAFDVMLVARERGRMFGKEVSPKQVVLFTPGCEVDALGLPGVETLHVQVPKQRLITAATNWNVKLVQLPRATVVKPGIDRMRRFSGLLDKATEILDRGDLTAWCEVEAELLVTLAAVFDKSAGHAQESVNTIGSTAQYSLEVRNRIHSDGLADLDLDRIAKSLGIGRRHLNRCFKQHYGVSIQKFIRSRRLHAARDLLLDRAAAVNVTAAAYGCGFGHLGRFSAEYKHLFGESPRQTLNQVLSQS